MLNPKVVKALNDYIDDYLTKIPKMKEFQEQIKYEKELGYTKLELRYSLFKSVIHDIRHESLRIFMVNSSSGIPTDSEVRDMYKVSNERMPEIKSILAKMVGNRLL